MEKDTSKNGIIRFSRLLNMLPIVGLIVYYYTNYIAGTYSFVLPIGLITIWLLLSGLSGNAKGLLFNNTSVWWMVFLFLCVVMVVIGRSTTNLNFIISRLPIYLTPAVGVFVVKYYNGREKTVLLAAFFIVFYINLIYNIFLGIQIPEIFEEQASTEESIKFNIMMNIAETSFIDVSYWLIGALIMTMLVISRKGWSFACILFIVPISYYILFQNTRGTTVLLFMVELLGLVLAYFEPKVQKKRKGYYISMMGLLLIVSVCVFIPVMNWAIENVQSDRLVTRLKDLLELGTNKGDSSQLDSGSLSRRIELSRTSLNTFFANPINMLIGIGDRTMSFGGDLVKSGIGGHSEFIDVLARYGLVGAFVYYKIISNYRKFLKKYSVSRDVFKYVNVLFIIIVIAGFLNVLFNPCQLLFMYVVLPAMIDIVVKRLDLQP